MNTISNCHIVCQCNGCMRSHTECKCDMYKSNDILGSLEIDGVLLILANFGKFWQIPNDLSDGHDWS